MKQRMNARLGHPLRGRRGVGVVEIAFVSVGFLIAFAIAAKLILSSGAAAASQEGYRQTFSQYDSLVLRWRKESQTALAAFIPGVEDPASTTDVLGASNADKHAFDFYFRDASGTGSFVEYLFKASDKKIHRYEYSTWVTRTTTAREVGEPVAATSVAIEYLHAYDLGNAAKNPDSAAFITATKGSSPKEKLANLGFPGVDAGNRIVVVRLGTPANSMSLLKPQSVHLMAVGGLGIARGTDNISATGGYTPVPYPLVLTPSSLVFPSQGSGSQPFMSSEQWYRSGYSIASNTCASIASVVGTTPGGAPGPGGTNSTFMIAPNPAIVSTQSCIITIQDGAGQQQAEAITVSYVPPATPTPRPTPTAAPTGGATPGPTPTPRPTPPSTTGTASCSDQPFGTQLSPSYYSSGTRCALMVSALSISPLYTPGDASHANSSSFTMSELNTSTGLTATSDCYVTAASGNPRPSAGLLNLTGGTVTFTLNGATGGAGSTGNCTIYVTDTATTQTITVRVLPNTGNPTPAPSPTPTATPSPTPTPTATPSPTPTPPIPSPTPRLVGNPPGTPPQPPPPCALDSYGYCAVVTANSSNITGGVIFCQLDPPPVRPVRISGGAGTASRTWTIYNASGPIDSVKMTLTLLRLCSNDPLEETNPSTVWSGDPKTTYGDPLLPGP